MYFCPPLPYSFMNNNTYQHQRHNCVQQHFVSHFICHILRVYSSVSLELAQKLERSPRTHTTRPLASVVYPQPCPPTMSMKSSPVLEYRTRAQGGAGLPAARTHARGYASRLPVQMLRQAVPTRVRTVHIFLEIPTHSLQHPCIRDYFTLNSIFWANSGDYFSGLNKNVPFRRIFSDAPTGRCVGMLLRSYAMLHTIKCVDCRLQSTPEYIVQYSLRPKIAVRLIK